MIRRLHRTWEKNWPELHCILRGGAPPFILARRPRELAGSVPVFCYHRIDEERFGADLAFLARNGYRTLDADDLAEHMEGTTRAPERAVVLTIDDGMRDLYERAYPLLREHGMKAVAFVSPGLHGREVDRRRDRLCTWEEMEEMHLSGAIDFQSHTLEHRLVSNWPAPSGIRDDEGWLALRRRGEAMTLRKDLLAARLMLERRLRKKVRHLAFPQYAGTARGVKAALSCGYRSMWWGMLPGRPANAAGDPLTHIVRVSGEFLQRLPGEGRVSLASIVRIRLLATAAVPGKGPARSRSAGHGRLPRRGWRTA